MFRANLGDVLVIATLPDRLESFVQSEVATGHYASREEVIAAAVYQMQLRQGEGVDLKEIKVALAEADEDFAAGRVRTFESEVELRVFAEEIKSRGRVRLASEKVLP